MLRQEARRIADIIAPPGFRFDDLTLGEDADGNGEWVARFTDENDPNALIIERWQDVYTELDPEPVEDTTGTTDENANESENATTEVSDT